MPILRCLALICLALALFPAPTSARVSVSFTNPGQFDDPDLHGLPVAAEITSHLQRLGTRYLPHDTDLKINILSLRLAGQYQWWRTGSAPRLMNDATWPVITVRYVLSKNGRVLESREETISDQTYLTRSPTISSGALPYEKATLEDWFRERFANRQAN